MHYSARIASFYSSYVSFHSIDLRPRLIAQKPTSEYTTIKQQNPPKVQKDLDHLR